MILIFAVILLSVSGIIGSHLVSQEVEDTARIVEQLSQEVAAPFGNSNAESLQEICESNWREYGGRVLVLDMNGVVQADSFFFLNGYRLEHREVQQILTGENLSAYGFHRIEQDVPKESGQEARKEKIWTLYYAAPIFSSSKTIGVLLLSTSLYKVERSMLNLQMRIIIVFAVIAVLSSALAYIVSRFITRPIKNLTDAAIEISSGKFDKRLTVKGHSEIAQLSTTFNMMCEKLENLENHRNEFVSNASHELKTPLSSIKILTESLFYQPPDEEIYKEFLKDINSEIDRLNLVISDLLLLVRIDQQEEISKTVSISMPELLNKIDRSLTPLANTKNIALTFEMASDISVSGDELKLQQVFYNLVDNAIKYTPEGGHVTVTLDKIQKFACVTVRDDGIGIPEKDIPHIFDRFYRVDKARSRATGGTGLGLSIVQKIILMHGGRIEVESTEGEGSTFTVYLPRE